MRDSMRMPVDLERMGVRQQGMLRVIFASGGATVREIHSRIPDPPESVCGIRTLLNRLVRKGVLKTRPAGRHSEVLYLPADTWSDLQRRAFERIAEEHFGGSVSHAIHELMRLAANETGQRLPGSRRAA